MRAIKFNFPDHYSILERWWNEHPEWEPVPPALLPASGFMIKADQGHFVAAGFIYFTNSALVSFEWIVSNPSSDKKERSKALDLLFKEMLASVPNGKAILSYVSNDSLIKRFKDNGFTENDKGMTGLMKVLPPKSVLDR